MDLSQTETFAAELRLRAKNRRAPSAERFRDELTKHCAVAEAGLASTSEILCRYGCPSGWGQKHWLAGVPYCVLVPTKADPAISSMEFCVVAERYVTVRRGRIS